MTLPLTKWLFFIYHIKQIDSLLPWVCTVINNLKRRNVVRRSETLDCTSRATFLFLRHIDVNFDLLLNRRTPLRTVFIK